MVKPVVIPRKHGKSVLYTTNIKKILLVLSDLADSPLYRGPIKVRFALII